MQTFFILIVSELGNAMGETLSQTERYPLDYERRFGGVARLYTKEGAARLAQASVTVVG